MKPSWSWVQRSVDLKLTASWELPESYQISSTLQQNSWLRFQTLKLHSCVTRATDSKSTLLLMWACNTAGSAWLWMVKSLFLAPRFQWVITCLQVAFQNIFVTCVLTSSQLPVEKCLWYSVFLHASKMSSPSELSLDEHSFNAFYLATFKYSSVWYSVLLRDATDFSEASKIELVKFFHMTTAPGPRFTRAWLEQLFYIHQSFCWGEYHHLTTVCDVPVQSCHLLY